MAEKLFWLFLILALLFAGLCCYFIYRNRKLYRTIDRMMSEILDRKAITESDIKEGEISALASKAKRIQELVEAEVAQSGQEKEQVKQLISNMSHQLKTPLANVMMYEEILENQELDRAQQLKFLEKMRAQSEKIDWLLQSLFKMVKLEQNAITFETADLPVQDTLLDAIGTVYEKAEKKGIAIEVVDKDNPVVIHNRKWTGEVFANLLENAVKYTNEGGKIWIRIVPLEMYTGIEFHDMGIGIAPSEYQAVFGRFYRSKAVENSEGSGIGLYLSKMILEKEKGYLTVSSQLGKGSCFTVFLQNCKN